jgi:phage shock protein PspC (stress-responsive transcriptional regulator)
MKRTLNINIGNSIIHIEEDAFELLTNYLIEVKQHFGKSADDFEIVSDIENRIAEMFSEMLLAQQKQVIELEDVQVVIGLMGSVKDFEDQSDDEPAAAHIPYTTFGERKIYRDIEEGMVAGVCSGLSHYLKMDVSILRVLAVMSVLLGGSGLIAYLILWVSIPKAVSRSEKMAMRGEAVNLQGFKRNFEEELASLKQNFQNANEHLQPLVKRSGSFIAEFLEVIGRFLQGSGRIIFKFIAIVIVIMGSVMLLCSVITIAALLGFWDSAANEIFPLSMVDASYFTTFITALFIVIAIPLFALILFSVRVAFNSRPLNKMVTYGLLLIWLAGVSVSIFYVAKVSAEFKEEAEFTQAIPLKPYPGYTLELDRSRFFSKEDSLRYRLNAADYAGKVIQNQDDDHFSMPRNVSIKIERSENGSPSLTQSYGSQGITFEAALNHAKNIKYDFVQKDSVLLFSPELHLKKNANWRDQRVELILRIPEGMKLNIDKKLDRYIQNYSLWNCHEDGDDDHENKQVMDNLYRGIMTAEGLTCWPLQK